jgi:hypothetical protein
MTESSNSLTPLLEPLAALQRLIDRFQGIRLPTPEDLIIFKAVAHRPKDLLDIQAIIESHPGLDRERIKAWVTEFSRILEMPELWADIAGLLSEANGGCDDGQAT